MSSSSAGNMYKRTKVPKIAERVFLPRVKAVHFKAITSKKINIINIKINIIKHY
jgi:hypothetical protein